MPATLALTWRDWAAPVRAHGASVLADARDPHAELLALVWGPRFDRQHAQDLLSQRPALHGAVLQTVMNVADRFDRLGSAQQQRLRRFILRHRAQAAGW